MKFILIIRFLGGITNAAQPGVSGDKKRHTCKKQNRKIIHLQRFISTFVLITNFLTIKQAKDENHQSTLRQSLQIPDGE